MWKKSTIYILCQKKLIYFTDLTAKDGVICGKIAQKDNEQKLDFTFELGENTAIFPAERIFKVDIQFFYETEKETNQPYKKVAGFRIFDENENFIVWLNPERLIFEFLRNTMTINLSGDIGSFIKYKVHYIGQSQDQNIWERLTGHEKVSRILSTVMPLYQGEFSPFEHTIILFHLDSFTDATMLLPNSYAAFPTTLLKPKKANPSEYDEDATKKAVVNDFEAFLINLFEPEFNLRKYKNYPNTKNGLKALGFDQINHQYLVFSSLETDECKLCIDITPIYRSDEE